MIDRDQGSREARARAIMAAVWAVGGLLVSALLIGFAGRGTPTGRLFAVLGAMVVVGILVAICLVAVNVSLSRRPDRDDAAGAADFLTVAAVTAAVVALVLGLLVGRPYPAVALALGLLWLVQFGWLLLIAVGTRVAARRAARATTSELPVRPPA